MYENWQTKRQTVKPAQMFCLQNLLLKMSRTRIWYDFIHFKYSFRYIIVFSWFLLIQANSARTKKYSFVAWKALEDSSDEKFPKCLKHLLITSGYDKLYSLGEIDEKNINRTIPYNNQVLCYPIEMLLQRILQTIGSVRIFARS